MVLWSFIPVVSRFGQLNLDNFQFLFWSNLLSLFIVFGCMLVARGRKNCCDIVQKLSVMKIIYILFLGFLGCTFYYLCLYYGYAHGNGLEVLVLQYSWPIFIIILSAFLLSERLPVRSWVAVFFGFVGILLVLTKGNFSEIQLSSPFVSATVVAGAFGFALFSVLSKKLHIDPYMMTSLLFVGGLLTSAASLYLVSDFAFPERDELIPVVVNGALINGISYIFWLKALEKIPASISAVLVFLAPVLSSIWIVLFFQEPFYGVYLIGLTLVIISGYVCAKNNQAG